MKSDPHRTSSIRDALANGELSGLVCSLPAHVLMLSGYCPVVGTSLAVANRDGKVVLIVPEDEKELSSHGRADEVRTFSPASLEDLHTATEAIEPVLRDVAQQLQIRGNVGIELTAVTTPTTYPGVHIYSAQKAELVERAISGSRAVSADELLKTLCSIKSPNEIERIRFACGFVAQAFEQGVGKRSEGKTEIEIAAAFRPPLYVIEGKLLDSHRADGFVHCMSGSNAAQAFGAYARSRSRIVGRDDLLLVHCNSHVDGFWTDVTRTYTIAKPDDRQKAMYQAIFEARSAALAAIAPGAAAADVDRAARDVLEKRGFGNAFKHPTGHGVGFAAINHNALPRLHPKSPDVLQIGMVFNVEPGIYIDGYGGMRHCDMVAITEQGVEVLTTFQSPLASLSL